jgi:glutamate---cysteine ligase / carboxylate-amine ligase
VSSARQSEDSPILAGVRERFEASTDLTVGIEEEYQLLDPATMALASRFEELIDAADEAFRPRLAGELISSEIEFRTAAHAGFAGAARDLVEGRLATVALAERLGIGIAVSGVHPFSEWRDQRIIDTEHYRRVRDELGYIAWTNNTWSIHVHCGVRGADRAVAVTTALRSVLPELLALSANSPVFIGRPSGLASTRTQIFTKSFPRCGIPDALAGWDEYAEYVRMLERTRSIVESTQIWHSVRPHHAFGTIEFRVCDGQTEMRDALAVSALVIACIAAFLRDHDEGRPLPAHPHRLLEENFWRAERNGVAGNMIDLDRGVEVPTPAAIEALLEWSEPHHGPLGLTGFLARVPEMLAGNGASWQLRRLEELGGDTVALTAALADRTVRSAEETLPHVKEVATV